MQNYGMKGTVLVGTKKIIPAKQREAVGRTSPRVYQKEDKVLQIARADAIVHPWAMVVHAGNAAIADAAVMRARRFEGLTLSTHTVRVSEQALSFHRNGLNGDAAWVRKGGLGVTRQTQEYENSIYFPRRFWNAFGRCKGCHCKGRIKHEQPNHGRHNSTCLI